MKIGVLGSGVVGQTLGAKLAQVGHEVVLGTRSPDAISDKRGLGGSLEEWAKRAGDRARLGTFSEAAAHGEVVISATKGDAALAALELAGRSNLAGKIVIEVSNPLDFSRGMPPTLTVCNTDSLGEQVQRALPDVKVVKALNTVTANVMVEPAKVANGDHHLFVCGNSTAAKEQVSAWLREWFGWKEIIDLGDITAARGTEMVLPLWIRLMGALGTPMFNFRIVR
jgi:8-hydroxy-5-deazaflavin:NADPH oxidoreductase